MAIKREFDEALAAEQMQRCPRCKERWFDVELKADGICKRCHVKDDKKRQDEPFLFSAGNKLDFGSVPENLPRLGPLEEMFIARVHVSVNVFTVCDASLRKSLLLIQHRFVGSSTSTVDTSCTSCGMLARSTVSSRCCRRIWMLSSSDHVDPRMSVRWTDNFAAAFVSGEQRSSPG